jgi:hypothetical protein
VRPSVIAKDAAMPDQADFDLERFLPYLLNQAAEATSKSFQASYKATYGMTRTQWRVLANLGKFGSMTARDICTISHIEKAANPASSADRITCTSASVSTSGGDRMMFGPDTRTIAPPHRPTSCTRAGMALSGAALVARSATSSSASISPCPPRTSPITVVLGLQALIPAQSCAPRAAAFSTTFSRFVSARQARAAAAPTGWPE